MVVVCLQKTSNNNQQTTNNKQQTTPNTMNQQIKTFSTLLLCFIFNSCYGQNSSDSTPVSRSENDFPLIIISPELPECLEFAGVVYDLTRSDLRERLDREIINLTYTHAATLLVIKRANRFFPEIEPILKANNIPDDFKYLALIESNLIPDNRSPAGALGLWQFMEATAKEYGLTVNSNVDERLNIEKATVAACKYIRDAYKIYGDWTSVMASYNAGMLRISKELEKQKVKSAMDLWLVSETSRYIFRIFAAKIIFSDPQKYGFLITKEQLYPPMEYKKVKVNNSIDDLVTFANEHNINYLQLKTANLWLRDTTLQNKNGTEYTILIPTEKSLNYNPKNTKVHNKNWVVK